MKTLLLIVLTTLTSSFVFASGNPDAVLGVWANSSNKAHIEIYKHKGKYFGKIIWLKTPMDEDGKPKVDKHNPKENERNNKLMGLVTIRDFKYDDDEWTGGKVYNPADGKEYNAYMKMKNSKTLTIRGYIGISLFGKTEVFTRIK